MTGFFIRTLFGEGRTADPPPHYLEESAQAAGAQAARWRHLGREESSYERSLAEAEGHVNLVKAGLRYERRKAAKKLGYRASKPA